MTKSEFNNLIQLTRMKPDSIASKGAFLVLVEGKTQTKAAIALDCQQTTISRSVRLLKDRRRLALQIV